MQALYFPKQPVHQEVVAPEIKQAIKNNPFIKQLSDTSDVLARFVTTEGGIHHLRLDVFNNKIKDSCVSMLYSSRLYDLIGGKIGLSATEFISHIHRPEKQIKTVYKGNIIDKIFRRKPEKAETVNTPTEYYNISFLKVDTDYTKLDSVTLAMSNALNNLEKQYRNMNKEMIEGYIS